MVSASPWFVFEGCHRLCACGEDRYATYLRVGLDSCTTWRTFEPSAHHQRHAIALRRSAVNGQHQKFGVPSRVAVNLLTSSAWWPFQSGAPLGRAFRMCSHYSGSGRSWYPATGKSASKANTFLMRSASMTANELLGSKGLHHGDYGGQFRVAEAALAHMQAVSAAVALEIDEEQYSLKSRIQWWSNWS